MKSTAHINGHPIHPMLIPYPFALLSSALVFDLGARRTRRAAWSQTASHLATAGLASALVAAVPGIVDYFGTIRPRTSARRSATQHALLNLSALACFALAASRRGDDHRLPDEALALEALGTGLMSVAGWIGGELVYHEHVAVVEDGSRPAPAVRGATLGAGERLAAGDA